MSKIVVFVILLLAGSGLFAQDNISLKQDTIYYQLHFLRKNEMLSNRVLKNKNNPEFKDLIKFQGKLFINIKTRKWPKHVDAQSGGGVAFGFTDNPIKIVSLGKLKRSRCQYIFILQLEYGGNDALDKFVIKDFSTDYKEIADVYSYEDKKASNPSEGFVLFLNLRENYKELCKLSR